MKMTRSTDKELRQRAIIRQLILEKRKLTAQKYFLSVLGVGLLTLLGIILIVI